MNNKRFGIILIINLSFLILRHLTVSDSLFVTAPFSNPILPSVLRLIPEILSFLLFVYCLTTRWKKIVKYWRFFIFGLLFSLITSSILSISNGDSFDFVRILSSLRSWFIWISPFFMGMTLFEVEDLPDFYKSFIVICIIQVPIIFIQSRLVTNEDLVTGLMGENGSGFLAIFQTIGSLYLLEYILSKQISLLPGLLLASIILLPVILSNALIVFLIVPFSWLLYFIISKYRRQKLTYGILTTGILIFIVYAMLVIFSSESKNSNDNPINFLSNKISVAIENSATSYNGPTRIYYLLKIVDYVSGSPTSLLFGYGIGYASSSRLSYNTINETILAGSTGVGSKTAKILLENGFAGIIILLLFFGGIFYNQFKSSKLIHRKYISDYTALAITILILVGALIFYNDSFTAPPFAFILMPQLGIYAKKYL
jgi:hypothetical protein